MTLPSAGLVTLNVLLDLEDTHSLLTNALSFKSEGFLRFKLARWVDMVLAMDSEEVRVGEVWRAIRVSKDDMCVRVLSSTNVKI